MDDDPDDREALKEALQAAGSTRPVVEATDGHEALLLLQELKAKKHLPGLIVLDMNMPRVDGRETLLSIRADSAFDSLPVVVLSTSSSDWDRLWFTHRNVPFLTKPHDFAGIRRIAVLLLNFCV